MTRSASNYDEMSTQEAMPLDLLPLHQGLEEDGYSWRAMLPLPDNLLRRVAGCPPRAAAPTYAFGIDFSPVCPFSARRHRRHTRERM